MIAQKIVTWTCMPLAILALAGLVYDAFVDRFPPEKPAVIVDEIREERTVGEKTRIYIDPETGARIYVEME